jgi:hypothetical protein
MVRQESHNPHHHLVSSLADRSSNARNPNLHDKRRDLVEPVERRPSQLSRFQSLFGVLRTAMTWPDFKTVLRGFFRLQIRNSSAFKHLGWFSSHLRSLSQWPRVLGRYSNMGGTCQDALLPARVRQRYISLECALKRSGSNSVGRRKQSRDDSVQRAHSTTSSAKNCSCLRRKPKVARSSPRSCHDSSRQSGRCSINTSLQDI